MGVNIFLLKNLPNTETLKRYKSTFPELNVSTMQLSLSLLKLSSVLIKRLEEYFSEYNLTLAKFLALIVIQRESRGYLLISEIADHMGVSKKNTSRLLDSLVRDGLVSINSCSTDRRVRKVSLLADGNKALESVLPGYYKLLNCFFRTIKSNQRNQVSEILVELLERS